MKLAHPELFNIDLAQEVLDYVERFPERHNQHIVMSNCGSAGCLVGWAAVLSHEQLVNGDRIELGQRILGLSDDEDAFEHVFGAGSEERAKVILYDYIAQAMAVQYTQSDVVLAQEEMVLV